jgi:glycosyltransferase involved in cell wall biosynthesis
MLPLLRQKRIPFTLDVVSGFAHGERVYTDTGADFYARDLGRLDAGEVRVHGPMRNEDVLRLIEASDLCLLPTLDDSFGFSLLESMSCAVPVIATAVCAIPEIVDDGADGVLLPLPTDGDGRWHHIYAPREERLSPRHRSLLDATLDGLARGLAGAIERLLDRELDYERLSQGAIDKIRSRFEMGRQAERWHAIYRACIGANG